MSESPDVKNIMKAIDLAIMAQVNMQLTVFDANKLKVHIDALNAEIAELKDQLRWIPVSERKPTVDDCRIDPLGRRIPYVIGIVDGHLHGLIHLDYFAKDNVYTHWMSLPRH